MCKKLHIIAFDIPYPANYGGAIDVYYKILNLSQLGIKITLHCFKYGTRTQQQKLEEICEQVFYYPRLKLLAFPQLLYLPYIVASRKNEALLKNLQANNAPILMEGLHTCFYLNNSSLRDRKKWVRMHNIEGQYYHALAQNEGNFLKRLFFKREAKLLQKFEQKLAFAQRIFALSTTDFDYLKNHCKNLDLLPVFHDNTSVNSLTGEGDYFLYHGNLTVSENEIAALFLIAIFEENAFGKPLVIAGKNPSHKLKKRIENQKNIILKENPTSLEMNSFIAQAHIHILPTFQPTGIKLKLINALFKGRFCLVNPAMLSGTNLQSCCLIAQTKQEFIATIEQYCHQSFTQAMIDERREILMQNFDNTKNAHTLIKLLQIN